MTDAPDMAPAALEACPFCGGNARLLKGGPCNNFIRCDDCNAGSDDGSEERAIAAWNRRAARSAPEAGKAVDWPDSENERICVATAMHQWEASLKRPDLTEKDRVRGALAAYTRQAIALTALASVSAPSGAAEADRPETIADNPKSWIAWKHEAEALRRKLEEHRKALENPTDKQIRWATTEYLSHRGERPNRILRGGQELWEAHAPSMREAFRAAARALSEREGKAVAVFAEAILHGDDEHRAWLTEAADAFIAGQPLPPPRGKGTGPAPQAVPAEDVAKIETALLKLSKVGLGYDLNPHDKWALKQAATALTSISAERDRQREYIRKQAEDIMTLGRLVYPKDGIGSDDTWKARCAASEAEATSLRRKLEEHRETLAEARERINRYADTAAEHDLVARIDALEDKP